MFSIGYLGFPYNNHVYQILADDPEAQFLIAAYDYENLPGNSDKLYETKHRNYFDKNKIAKKIVFHEWHPTGSYE